MNVKVKGQDLKTDLAGVKINPDIQTVLTFKWIIIVKLRLGSGTQAHSGSNSGSNSGSYSVEGSHTKTQRVKLT